MGCLGRRGRKRAQRRPRRPPKQFEQAGDWDVARSWIGTGPNKLISPDDIKGARTGESRICSQASWVAAGGVGRDERATARDLRPAHTAWSPPNRGGSLALGLGQNDVVRTHSFELAPVFTKGLHHLDKKGRAFMGWRHLISRRPKSETPAPKLWYMGRTPHRMRPAPVPPAGCAVEENFLQTADHGAD